MLHPMLDSAAPIAELISTRPQPGQWLASSDSATVTLTGIVSDPPARALLAIAGRGLVLRFVSLGEGETDGSVEVIGIDIATGRVRIRNGGKENELSVFISTPPARSCDSFDYTKLEACALTGFLGSEK